MLICIVRCCFLCVCACLYGRTLRVVCSVVRLSVCALGRYLVRFLARFFGCVVVGLLAGVIVWWFACLVPCSLASVLVYSLVYLRACSLSLRVCACLFDLVVRLLVVHVFDCLIAWLRTCAFRRRCSCCLGVMSCWLLSVVYVLRAYAFVSCVLVVLFVCARLVCCMIVFIRVFVCVLV